MINSLIIINFYFFLIFLAYLTYIKNKTLGFPGTLLIIFWVAMTAIPQILVTDVQVQLYGLGYIALAIFFFTLPIFLLPSIKTANNYSLNLRENSIKGYIPRRYILFFISLFCIVLILYDLFLNGIGLSGFLDNPFRTTGRMSGIRYSSFRADNFFGIFIFPFSYLSAALAGMRLGVNKPSIVDIFLGLSPAVLIALTQSAKGSLLLSIVFLAAGYILVKDILLKPYFRFNLKNIFGLIFLIIILFLILYYTFYSRGLSDAKLSYVDWKIKSYFISYSSGHFYAFNDWLSWYLGQSSNQSYIDMEQTYGAMNFMFIYELFGYADFNRGIFTDWFKSGEYLNTNIYTMFRATINDFGLIGSLIYFFIMGLIFNTFAYAAFNGRINALIISVYILSIGFVYQSYIFGILNYRSIFGFNLALILILSFVKSARIGVINE